MSFKALQELTNLSGRVAIVTGGAVGIGQGISYRLAEAGASVLVADISQDHLNIAKEAFSGKDFNIEYLVADVANAEEVTKMVKTAVAKFGALDILVNNAGIYPSKLLMDMTSADFDRVLAVNLKGVFLATKAAADIMISQGRGGRIVNITSIDALHPSSAGLAHYDASKHGVWGFTKNAALELATHKIWINAVAPGGIATPGTEASQESAQAPKGVDMSKMLEAFLARIPMKRLGEPDDIAKAVLFLTSDMSSYMTGSQIVVDGGVLLA
ncbi:MAG TPA: SDR family NAD(P)-dependent oxidoreductase [Candidatus Saccharimonadales bacterium]|nr:SDR family NAD(P)-dependent oxidoreductase [Candidatus Saccharimonadales bacterium]